jgi:hypothetical protein
LDNRAASSKQRSHPLGDHWGTTRLRNPRVGDLAVAIADGADAVTGIEVLRDREALIGPVASMPGVAAAGPGRPGPSAQGAGSPFDRVLDGNRLYNASR